MLLVSCMRMRKCKRFEPVTIGHIRHSRSTTAVHVLLELLKSLQCTCDGDVPTSLKCRYYWTIETGMTENRLPCLSLHERLGSPLSMAHEREHEALCASVLGMHLHDHNAYAHDPTVLTNPERSESASFMPLGNDTDYIRKMIV